MMHHRVEIINGSESQVFEVEDGTNLRLLLLEKGLSPYTALTRVANCGGRGICATCGVWIDDGEPPPEHWHDKLAARFGYPRLSCQISVHQDMVVQLVADKRIWGDRDPARKYQ